MRIIQRISLRALTGIVALSFAGIASATTFNFSSGNLGITGGNSYNTINTSLDGIGLTITALNIVNDGIGNISSTTTVTGAGLGVYLSSSTSGNLGVLSNTNGDGTNLDGDSGTPSPNDPDEGLLFSFDQQVSLNYINFDSFTSGSTSADDFNLTVDGVSVLVDHNASDVSSLVTNVPAQFDEYIFNNIIGTEFLFWADSDSDSFRIDFIEVSAVPVPAAAWLFGSALLGMFGFSRRKKA